MPRIRKASRHLALATAVALAWTGQSNANNEFLALVGQIPATDQDTGKTVRMNRLPSTQSAQPELIDPHTTLTNFAEEGEEKATADTETSDNVSDEDGTVSMVDYKSLLERFEDMESSWKKHQEKLDKAAADKKKKPITKLNGRIHLDNWYFMDDDEGIAFLENDGDITHDPENRWDFRRIRLTWTGDVPGNMTYRIMIDFNNPNRPEMKDVYFGFKHLPFNQTLLLGNQKRPIGLDHLNSSRHNVFIERPLAVETFNEDARRLGLCMYGYSDSELFHWRYGAFLLENITGDGRYRGDFTQGGLYGRLCSSPWYDKISGGRGYYHWAVAGSVNQTDGDGEIDLDQNSNEARFRTRPLARSDSRWWNTGRILGGQSYQQVAIEQMLNIGRLQITGEYFTTWTQRNQLGAFAGDDLFFHGGYIFASYFLTGEYIPYSRTRGTIDRVKPLENFFLVDRCCGGCGHGWGALAIALRYDFLDLTDSDIQGGRGYAWTAGMNWYWTAYSKVQTNFIWGSIEDAGEAVSPSPTLAGVDGDFSILGMRYMIDF